MARACARLKHLLAVGVLTGCASSHAPPPSSPSALLDKPLPNVQGYTLDGARIAPSSSVGHPVVIKFFAQYCEPCLKTLPVAERFHRSHPEVTVIGVSEDDSRATAENIRQRYGLTFPVVHDAEQVWRGRFRVTELPATFVADKSAVVRWSGGNESSEDTLGRVVDSISR